MFKICNDENQPYSTDNSTDALVCGHLNGKEIQGISLNMCKHRADSLNMCKHRADSPCSTAETNTFIVKQLYFDF